MAKVKVIPAPTKNLQAVVDDGTREIPLVNNFGKLICKVYMRPGDLSIVDRYNDFVKDFDKIVEPLAQLSLNNDGTATFEEEWTVLKSVEDEVKKRFNELFDMEEADEIFAKRLAFASVGGEFFCFRVLMALQNVIADVVEEEARLSNQRTNKYLQDLNQRPEVTANAGKPAENA